MLSCLHEPSPHSDHTTGTAHTHDGREICWDCATLEERLDLLARRDATAYLSKDRHSLTTWTGSLLAQVTSLSKGRHNIGGYLYRFRAVDVWGNRWYGTSPGPGMYARLHRTKGA